MILAAAGIAVAIVGVPLAALGVIVALMQDKGRRAAYRRPSAAAILARDLRDVNPAAALWEWLQAPDGPAPIVTEAEVAEEFAARPLAPGRPVNGVYRGTQPRRTPGPFTAVDMPTTPAPDPGPAWRTAAEWDSLGPDVPIARPWTADRVAYGVASCQLDVAEAQRQFALAMGPDGCEAVS